MSLIALEKALYDLGVQGQSRKAFSADSQAFLGNYKLGENEKQWLCNFEVPALLSAGVNPMLAMGYWMFLHPSHSMSAYIKALNPGAVAHG